ncbi:hypothetical protein [Gimesia aquarii]|uniref:Uncharacterized protein n=1 Tax=Gimesia aquarii TaxID=2527964 RepID=A0A517VWV2_9PLAN|nr:hypothetical protein [Gimesia aquarii]QDT97483.1 hypothetical protein V144x_29580 [Gimesia aquarii]
MQIRHFKKGLCAAVLLFGAIGLANYSLENKTEKDPSSAYFFSTDVVQFYPASAEEELYNQREVLEQYKKEIKRNRAE